MIILIVLKLLYVTLRKILLVVPVNFFGRTFAQGICMENFITEEEMNKTRTFREKLLIIQKEAQENRKASVLYKNIKDRIKFKCERAAAENLNCLHVNDLLLGDFSYMYKIHYYENMNKVFHEIICMICKEFDLEFDGQYIMWSNGNL